MADTIVNIDINRMFIEGEAKTKAIDNGPNMKI